MRIGLREVRDLSVLRVELSFARERQWSRGMAATDPCAGVMDPFAWVPASAAAHKTYGVK